MKRILVLALIGIMVFCMTAWGAEAETAEAETAEAETAEAETAEAETAEAEDAEAVTEEAETAEAETTEAEDEAEAEDAAEAETEEAEDADTSESTKTLQLGSSSYTIEIPESYEEEELSEEDIQKSMVAYVKSEEFDMDFDVYQFGKGGLPETTAELAEEEDELYDTYEIMTDLEINGIEVACCRAIETDEGKDYDTLTYYLDDGDTYVQVEFWLDGDNAEELSDMIISTLDTDAVDAVETAFGLEDIINSISESGYDIKGLFDQIADLVEIFMNDGETETVGNIIRAVGELINTIIKGENTGVASSELVRDLILDEDSLSQLSSGTVLDIYESSRDELVQRGIVAAE